MPENYYSSKIFDPRLTHFEKKLHMSAFFNENYQLARKKCVWAETVGVAGENGDEKLKPYV